VNPSLRETLKALSSKPDSIILCDEGAPHDDVGLHSILTLNLVPLVRVSFNDLESAQLRSNQIVVICSAPLPSATSALLETLRSHLASGGLVLTYNVAIRLVAQLLPGSIARVYSEPSSRDKSVRAKVVSEDDMDADADAPLLAQVHTLADSHHLVRLSRTLRFSFTSETVLTPLVSETAPSQSLGLVSRYRSGAGSLYHLVPFASDDATRPRSAEQSRSYLAKIDQHAELSSQTKRMWRTAQQCSLDGAFAYAVALLSFTDVFWAIVHRHLESHS